MAYVLKGVDKKFLRPIKNNPNMQSVRVPLPYGQFYKYRPTIFGNILIDNHNITEINDTTVDVTLYFDEYSIRFQDNNGIFIDDKTSSEQIYQQYFFFKLMLKEKAYNTEEPLYLRHVHKNLINKLNKDSTHYTIYVPVPQRLQHLAKILKADTIPSGYVDITDEEDIIANGTTNTYDICLKRHYYVIWFYDKNGIKQFYQITRGELLDAFNKFTDLLEAKRQNAINEVIESETTSSPDSYEILRHINHKNITYDGGTASVGVNIPESLKGKASTWWCSITVPEANVINEGKYKNNYFASVKLTKTEYETNIPTEPIANFHKDIRTKWEHIIVSRSELMEANEKQIQKMAEFFKDFDRLVEP